MGFKLSPEEIEALKKFAQDTPEKQISDMANRPSPYNFDILKSALGQGKFRDTGRESSGVGESLDSMAGAPVRQAIKEAQEGNFDRDAAMRVLARFGADPKNAPTGVDIASKVTSNPYIGAGLATAVDVGAQLPLPVRPGVVGAVKKTKAAAMPKGKMIGSDGSLDGIKSGIAKYFYSPNIELKPAGEGIWQVVNSKGPIDGTRVVEKGGRFRFEMFDGPAPAAIQGLIKK